MIAVDIITVALWLYLDILFQKRNKQDVSSRHDARRQQNKMFCRRDRKAPTVVERDKRWEGDMQGLWVLVFNL